MSAPPNNNCLHGFRCPVCGQHDEFRIAIYRRRATAPVVRNGGVIDKFIGDAVMAVFGVPRPMTPMPAPRFGVASRCWKASRRRARDSEPPVNVGIGAHYGEAILGVVGEGERLEYTVLGDTVNLAQRAERIAARSDFPMLVTREILEAARAKGSAIAAGAWVELAPRSVEGRRQPARFFALPAAGVIVPVPAPRTAG